MSDDEVEYCAEAVRKGDRDRWLCALFAPEPARPAVLALLAFNLELARIRDNGGATPSPRPSRARRAIILSAWRSPPALRVTRGWRRCSTP